MFSAPILSSVYQFNAANPVLTPMTVATCRSICRRGWRNTCLTNSRILYILHVPRHPERRFYPSSTTRSGNGFRTLFGYSGRGGFIAVMYETYWTGVSRPSWAREMDLQRFSPWKFALLGRHSAPAPPKPPPVSSKKNRRGTTGALFRDVGVGFEERIFESCSSSWNRGFHLFNINKLIPFIWVG